MTDAVVSTPSGAVRSSPVPPGVGSPVSSRRPIPAGVDLATFVRLLCIIDLDGSIVWCNDAFGRALGYNPRQLRGTVINDLLHIEDDPDRQRASILLMEGREVEGLELRLRTADGGWRWLEWTSHIDLARRLAFGVARDITIRHEAEDDLRQHEVIFVKDRDSRYRIVNNEFCRVTGHVDASEVIGRPTAEIWPQHREMITDHEAELFESGEIHVSDETMDTAIGIRHFLMTRAVLHDDEGRVSGMVGIATDITARKQMEDELRQRDGRLAALMRTSPDIIVLTDASGAISQISDAVNSTVGALPPYVTPEQVLARIHPDDRDRVFSEFAALDSGGLRQLNSQFRMRHSDGTWVTVEDRARTLVDQAGNFAGSVIVARDVTARLAARDQLQAAVAAAEQASRAKSEFLSRMSHELRTPLNSVLGFAQLLEMDELPDHHAEWVSLILSAGRQLLQLIDEVLDIARIETGHLELMLEPVRVAELLAESVADVTAMADAAHVQLSLGIEAPELMVLADGARLRQVVNNLLSNAVRFNRAGGHVDVRGEVGAQGWARLVVADTGRGMGPGNLVRVFEPLERVADGPDGSGVSLALSRRLVEDMGGLLGVDSVPDVGTTFSVALPLADAPDEATSTTAARPARPDVAAPGPFRVLLVEEDLANLPLVERVMARRPGVEVIASMHGGLAMELAREHHPGLVLLDLALPDVAGIDVLHRLQNDAATADIAVALVDKARAGESGPA
jgi:PAS domain S-box-containing protein